MSNRIASSMLAIIASQILILSMSHILCLAQQPNNQTTPRQPPIRLVIQTSKAEYHVGDPVEIIAYLENVSQDKFFYVGREFVGLSGSVGLHNIDLRTYDENNKEIVEGRGAGNWIWEEGTTIPQKIAQAYMQLNPGMIIGLKERGHIELPPGRYRLVATYREIEAQTWTEAERQSLKVPIWTQPLVSNTVMIKVLPKKNISSRRARPNNSFNRTRNIAAFSSLS